MSVEAWARDSLAAGMPADIVAGELDRMPLDVDDRARVGDLIRDLASGKVPANHASYLDY